MGFGLDWVRVEVALGWIGVGSGIGVGWTGVGSLGAWLVWVLGFGWVLGLGWVEFARGVGLDLVGFELESWGWDGF